MKALLLFVPVALIASCAEPAPLDLRSFEETDRRFAPPPPSPARERLDAALAKDELTIEDVLAVADAINPQLAIERKNVDLATAAIWEARLYPNPAVRLAIEEYPTSGSFSDAKRVIGIAQEIPVSGRLGAAAALAERQRDVAAVHFVWRRREILSDVKRAFVQVLAAQRSVALARESRDIAKSLHDATNERFKAQAIPEMELLKAAVSLAIAETDVRQAETSLAVAVKSLHGLMGDADFPKDRFTGDLTARFVVPSFEVLRGQVLAAHPLLDEAARAREAAQLDVDLAKTQRWPDIVVDISGGRTGDGDTIIEGGIEVPLPIFNRGQAKALQANLRLQQAELQAQSTRNDLVVRLTEDYRTLAAAQDRATVYSDEILPKAQKALDQTNDGYRLGKFGYLDLLDAQRTLAEAKSAHVAALADLNAASVELEKLTGMKLEILR